jgi:hypothetical protein
MQNKNENFCTTQSLINFKSKEIINLPHENYEKYLGNCRSVADFEKIEELGEGTYGRVCKSY